MKPQIAALIEGLKRDWCASFGVHDVPEGKVGHVATGLFGADGDALPVFISVGKDGSWSLTDRGQTFGNFPDDDDFEVTDSRRENIHGLIVDSGAKVRGYTIVQDLDEAPTAFDVGDFVQLISCVRAAPILLNQESRKTFTSVARDRIKKWLPSEMSYQTNWSPPVDGVGAYPTDFWMPGSNSLYGVASFFVSSDAAANRVNVIVSKYAEWDVGDSRLIVVRSDQVNTEGIGSGSRLEETARITRARIVRVEGDPGESDFSEVYDYLENEGVAVSSSS